MMSLLIGSILVAGGAPELPPVHPVAVRHHGHHEGNALVWRSMIVMDAAGLSRGTDRLVLAYPLPVGATVEGEAPVGLVRDDDGRVTAIDIPSRLWGPERHVRDTWTRSTVLTVRQKVNDRERVAMVVPLFAGSGVQRITMAGMEDLMYEPDPSIGIERHIRHFVAQEVTSAMRRDCNRILREHGVRAADGLAIFITATRRVTEAGSLGEIVSRESHRQMVATSAIAGCALLALAMLLAYKRLSRTAQLERSLAAIDKDLAEIDIEDASRAKRADTR